MPERQPVPRKPFRIDLDRTEFRDFLGWPFEDRFLLDRIEYRDFLGWPFEDRFVHRLLSEDIPRRVVFGHCRVWAYHEPEWQLAGFGTLDVRDEYGSFSGGRPHAYLPLLAVNPSIKSLGYGTSILRHLIDEAAILARDPSLDSSLYLDVYTTSVRAIELYRKLGFVELTDSPITDPLEGGQTYLIMAKRVREGTIDP